MPDARMAAAPCALQAGQAAYATHHNSSALWTRAPARSGAYLTETWTRPPGR